MKKPATPISAYVEAIEQLQNSVATFRTARESLQDAAASLEKIVKVHGEVAKSLGKTEKRVLELLPDEFQRTLSEQQKDMAQLILTLQSQLVGVEQATNATAATLVNLEQGARGRDQQFTARMKRDTAKIVQDFNHQTGSAATGLIKSLEVAIDSLGKRVEHLSAEIQSEEYSSSLQNFTIEIGRSSQEASHAADMLTNASRDFGALLTDATGSIRTTLSDFSNANRSVPVWGIGMLALQLLLIILVLFM